MKSSFRIIDSGSSTMASLSEEFVFEYFSHLNPIAYKIQAEINQTIENYEHLWNTITTAEQMTIINEAVIKPELSNYRTKEAPLTQPHLDQYRDIDASLLNYFIPKNDQLRPFSYKTKSQQNLFSSLNLSQTGPDCATVRLPIVKPKRDDPVTKSTDSLTCNFVNLNVKVKKGRAPAAPTKMTTKPPPPPPPTAKPVAKPIEAPPVIPVVPEPIQSPEKVIADIPKIPEDNNSNTSLLSPANPEEEEEEVVLTSIQPSAVAAKTPPTAASENDDEFKSLLDSNTGFDFLNNW